MKKLSLLVAFALIITIGGVYAAWSYAQGDVETAQGFVLPSMEAVTTTGSKGQISVNTSGLTMKVDDTDDGDAHNTKLVMNDGGKIVITFTPAEGADSTVVTNGIKMQADMLLVDVDAEEELARLFKVRSIPTLVFIPTEGLPVVELGGKGKGELKEKLDALK